MLGRLAVSAAAVAQGGKRPSLSALNRPVSGGRAPSATGKESGEAEGEREEMGPCTKADPDCDPLYSPVPTAKGTTSRDGASAPPRSSTQIGEVIARPELPSGSPVHSLDVPGARLYCDVSRNDFSTEPTLPVLRGRRLRHPGFAQDNWTRARWPSSRNRTLGMMAER